MKQWQMVLQVSSSELEKSLWNDCNEAAIDYLADGHRPLVLHLTGKSNARKENDGCGDLGDSNIHHKESKAREENSGEEIEESQPPLTPSRGG